MRVRRRAKVSQPWSFDDTAPTFRSGSTADLGGHRILHRTPGKRLTDADYGLTHYSCYWQDLHYVQAGPGRTDLLLSPSIQCLRFYR